MAPKASKKSGIQMCKTRETKRRNCDDEESNLSHHFDDENFTFSDYDSDENETFNPASCYIIHIG